MKLQIDKTRYFPGEGLVIEQETGDTHGKYRLTDAGITDTSSGWWYFYRHYEDKEGGDTKGLYVYRKIRKEPSKGYPGGEVVEEYVGKEWPFTVPATWKTKLRRRALSK